MGRVVSDVAQAPEGRVVVKMEIGLKNKDIWTSAKRETLS